MQYTVTDLQLAQRRTALKKANHSRTTRAEFKRQVKQGIDPTPVILDTPTEFAGMYVASLLDAMPKMGQTKVERMLKVVGIVPTARLGALTVRQRKELAACVRNGPVSRLEMDALMAAEDLQARR